MAKLAPCKTCGKKISTDAASCPSCGDSTHFGWKSKGNKKQSGGGVGCIGGVAIIAVVIWAFSALGPDDDDKNDRAEKTFTAAEKEKGFHCLSAWDGAHYAFKREVKMSMRNPKSFEHVETRIVPVGTDGLHTLSMKYRAENGFGGMNIGQALAEVRNNDCTHIMRTINFED